MTRVALNRALLLLLLAACGGTPPPLTTAETVVETPRAAPQAYDGPAPDGVDRVRIAVTDAQPSRGPATAPVTIVAFSDFQCPFCSRVAPTLDRIVEQYGEEVRIVWRNLPLDFHENARPAAALAYAAFVQDGDRGFWRAHDLLFENQRALERNELVGYGRRLGLGDQAIYAALGGAHDAVIEADIELAGRVGARGTPNFFINGEQLTGAQPFESFVGVIERARAAARFVRDRGVLPGDEYAALMVHASEGPPPRPEVPPAPARREPAPAAVSNLPLQGNLPSRGPADALITLVLFSDFECPFCGRLEPTLDALMQRYPSELRIVWMNNPLPFHQNAMPAAIAAHEAFLQGGDTAFWAMHERIFNNQRAITRANLEQWAGEVGLNLTQFRAALDGSTHRSVIEAQQVIARGLGASGTPSSFINGRNVRGAQPEPAFVSVIDEELVRARADVARGTAPGPNLYTALTAGGATEPQFVGPAPSAAPSAPANDHDYGIAVPADAPSRGASSPRIVVQIFSDFQCPFCSRAAPTVDTLVNEYGSQVEFVFRHYPLPFHNNAFLAAEAAVEVHAQVGDAGFWRFPDLLFANQRALARADLERYAQQIAGVNLQRFRRALDQRTHQARVQSDMDAVQNAGARIGTPSFFINGRLTQGAQPIETFRAAIDRELAR
ncbi:MAG: thioredoxin domain-containing protein [Myxococcota bacterium]